MVVTSLFLERQREKNDLLSFAGHINVRGRPRDIICRCCTFALYHFRMHRVHIEQT
jgi:hypothetical protein